MRPDDVARVRFDTQSPRIRGALVKRRDMKPPGKLGCRRITSYSLRFQLGDAGSWMRQRRLGPPRRYCGQDPRQRPSRSGSATGICCPIDGSNRTPAGPRYRIVSTPPQYICYLPDKPQQQEKRLQGLVPTRRDRSVVRHFSKVNNGAAPSTIRPHGYSADAHKPEGCDILGGRTPDWDWRRDRGCALTCLLRWIEHLAWPGPNILDAGAHAGYARHLIVLQRHRYCGSDYSIRRPSARCAHARQRSAVNRGRRHGRRARPRRRTEANRGSDRECPVGQGKTV